MKPEMDGKSIVEGQTLERQDSSKDLTLQRHNFLEMINEDKFIFIDYVYLFFNFGKTYQSQKIG